jgi:hypothetical protein
LGAKDARADQKILFLFCSWFLQKKKEDFLRLAQRTLVSFGNHTCNFAIMFGVLCDPKSRANNYITMNYINDS